MRPLAAYVRGLRKVCFVPDFDPLDAGVDAQLLMLLEKPGPRTFPPVGSGFVSRDNADPTARTLRSFALEAGIPRAATVIWNVVPWWNGTVAITGAEKRAGAAELATFLPLLPQLRGVLLCGNAAAMFGEPVLAGRGLRLFRSVHPSGQARAGPHSAERWQLLGATWRFAWEELTQASPNAET